jgi:hypothetical protein
VGFFRTFTSTMQQNANSLGAPTTRKLWAKGTVHPKSKRPFRYLMSRHSPFQALDVNQLDKDITEFGQSAAGAVLTQIARYSPVLNQSTGLSNEGFTCAFTHRITGSYRLLFCAGREMGDLALCPCLKKNGEPCSRPLNGYVHFIGCRSHGLHFYPHNRMEDTLYACYKDSLRTRIIRGQAFTCLNEDKRPRAIGNLVTSIPRTPGPYTGAVQRGRTTPSTPSSMAETKQMALQFMGVTSPATHSRSTTAPRVPTSTKTRAAWSGGRNSSTPSLTYAATGTSTPSTGMPISVRENTPNYRTTNDPKVENTCKHGTISEKTKTTRKR